MGVVEKPTPTLPAYVDEAPPPPYAADPAAAQPRQPNPGAAPVRAPNTNLHANAPSSSSNNNNNNTVARQFPPSFNLYSGFMTSALTIAQHQDRPIYSVSMHSGFSSQPSVVLHAGPFTSSRMLAGLELHSFSSRMDVNLPPDPSSSRKGPVTETVESRMNGFSRIHLFKVDVAGGGRETFEWRHSAGTAIGVLDANSTGWKLVRLNTTLSPSPPPPPPPQGSNNRSSNPYRTNTGHEIVAVWGRMSLRGSKVARFQFLGSGADGSLGERWALLAVMSALGMYEKQRRQSRSTAAGGAASAIAIS